jgi:hypothetical protein
MPVAGPEIIIGSSRLGPAGNGSAQKHNRPKQSGKKFRLRSEFHAAFLHASEENDERVCVPAERGA